MGKAGVLGRDIHQDIVTTIVVICVEDEIELDLVIVLDYCHWIIIGLMHNLEAEQPVERHGAIQIGNTDADMVDDFDIHMVVLTASHCADHFNGARPFDQTPLCQKSEHRGNCQNRNQSLTGEARGHEFIVAAHLAGQNIGCGCGRLAVEKHEQGKDRGF